MEHGPYRTSAAPDPASENEPDAEGELLGLWLFLWAISVVRVVGGAWSPEGFGAEGSIAVLVVAIASIPIRDTLVARIRRRRAHIKEP